MANFAAPQNLVAIKLGPDKRPRWLGIAMTRMTYERHLLCTAAMVLMPVSASRKALD
jgi:hypothetical protein